MLIISATPDAATTAPRRISEEDDTADKAEELDIIEAVEENED
jgi:hypothetical protein